MLMPTGHRGRSSKTNNKRRKRYTSVRIKAHGANNNKVTNSNKKASKQDGLT